MAVEGACLPSSSSAIPSLSAPLPSRGVNENSYRRAASPGHTSKRQKTVASPSEPLPSLASALYSEHTPAGPSSTTAPIASTETETREQITSTTDMAGPHGLTGQIQALLTGDARGSYGPISLFSPPGSRRSSANDDATADDLEAGAPAGLVSFVTSKRRQARHGRWIAIIIFVGGVAYFIINSMLVNGWISDKLRGMPHGNGGVSEKFDPAYVVATSTDHIGAGEWLGKGVRVIPDDPSHVLVPTNSSDLVELLQPFKRVHAPSLVEFYATGLMPDLPSSDIPYPTVDFIYTFVNASSPYLQSAMALKREQEGLPPSDRGASKHWRDNGEIRGSVRSSIQALGRTLNKVHLIAGDFALESLSVEADGEESDAGVEKEKEWMEGWKAGQVPVWLNTEADQGRVQWHFHSEVFRLPADGGVIDERVQDEWDDEDVWKNEATPSFSSFPIESRIGWVQGLGENFVYSNDDMFLTAPLELTDYHHPLLGPVIRVAGSSGLAIKGTLTPDLKSSSGEWGGLEHAGMLLKHRFTPRRRNYMMHMPKAMTKSMVHEASVMFAPELSTAATRSFRISKRGEADVHFAWLTSQLRIERWREALLWSWAVGRLGGQDGKWGEKERAEVMHVLGIRGDGDEDKMVWFKQQPRETIPDVEKIMEANKWDFPLGSDYVFSSMDGHIPEPGVSWESPRSCGIVPSQCFPSLFGNVSRPLPAEGIDAAEVFANITFDNYRCGDCLIIGLVAASGPRGLSAFLPEEDATFRPDAQRSKERQMWDRDEPMLPLVQTWQEANFSAANVVRSGQDLWEGSVHVEGRAQDGIVRMRDWCVKLLSRYIYSLADSPSMFVMTHNGREMQKVLREIESKEEVAMTCINDDQPDGADGLAGVYLGEWMEARFGEWEAGWEKEGWPWLSEEDQARLVVP